MVEDLLREFVAEPWVERLDFSTAERINAAFVSSQYAQREGDMVWRIETFAGLPVYVYVLLELQSTVDRFMPLRAMVYQGLLYQHLIAQELDDEELRRVLLDWLDRRLAKLGLPSAQELEADMESILDQRIERWAREEREQGRQEGHQEGEAQLLLTLLEQKFGPLDERSRMRLLSADADRLLEWGKRLIRAEHLADVFAPGAYLLQRRQRRR